MLAVLLVFLLASDSIDRGKRDLTCLRRERASDSEGASGKTDAKASILISESDFDWLNLLSDVFSLSSINIV